MLARDTAFLAASEDLLRAVAAKPNDPTKGYGGGGDSVRAGCAHAAMTKVMANHRKKLATDPSENTGN